jgi:cell division protein FtsZ
MQSDLLLPNKAVLKVVGVGGGGGNAVERMYQGGVKGVEFISMNTDHQALSRTGKYKKVQLGSKITRTLGAGGDPGVGLKAALESKGEVQAALDEADMIFITAGMGGGTGTGACPIIGEIARETGALTVAVVTRPFSFEGAQRKVFASEGISILRHKVDTLITIPNDRLLEIAPRDITITRAFAMVDDVLRRGVQGISDLITIPGLINVDFADVRTIMSGAGTALIGIGEAKGENAPVEAAKRAIESPLLETPIKGARGILMNISGGSEMSLQQINAAAEAVTREAAADAEIIFGAVIDEELEDRVRVTILAAGFAE